MRSIMPYIHIRVTDEGVTREQKRQLVDRTTKMMVDVLNKSPATTHVVIEEVPLDNWGVEGQLVSNRRRRQTQSSDS